MLLRASLRSSSTVMKGFDTWNNEICPSCELNIPVKTLAAPLSTCQALLPVSPSCVLIHQVLTTSPQSLHLIWEKTEGQSGWAICSGHEACGCRPGPWRGKPGSGACPLATHWPLCLMRRSAHQVFADSNHFTKGLKLHGLYYFGPVSLTALKGKWKNVLKYIKMKKNLKLSAHDTMSNYIFWLSKKSHFLSMSYYPTKILNFQKPLWPTPDHRAEKEIGLC